MAPRLPGFLEALADCRSHLQVGVDFNTPAGVPRRRWMRSVKMMTDDEVQALAQRVVAELRRRGLV